MGFLDALMGNASEMDPAEAQRELGHLLSRTETVERAYKLIRDMFIFTNKRLILIDKQGLTGKKIDYHSYPYKSITHFSIETAGHYDLDAELKIWISGSPAPISKTFNKSLNIYDLQKVLADHVLK